MPFLVESEVQDPCKWYNREHVLSSLRSGTSLLYVPPIFRDRIKSNGLIRKALLPVPHHNAPNKTRKLFTEFLDEDGVYLMIQANDEAKRELIDLVPGKKRNTGGDRGLEILDSNEDIKHALLGVELMVEEEECKIRKNRTMMVKTVKIVSPSISIAAFKSCRIARLVLRDPRIQSWR